MPTFLINAPTKNRTANQINEYPPDNLKGSYNIPAKVLYPTKTAILTKQIFASRIDNWYTNFFNQGARKKQGYRL